MLIGSRFHVEFYVKLKAHDFNKNRIFHFLIEHQNFHCQNNILQPKQENNRTMDIAILEKK